MSTRIYNSYLVGASLTKLIDELTKLRTVAYKKAVDRCRAALTNKEEKTADPENLLIARLLITEFIIEKGFGRTWGPVNDVSACVYSHPGDEFTDRGTLILQLFVDGSWKEEKQKLLKRLKATDYHYQNSTDKSANCSDAQWEARKKAWNKILKTGVPAKDGLSYDVLSGEDIAHAALSALSSFYPPKGGWREDMMCNNPDTYGMFMAQDAKWAYRRNTLKKFTAKLRNSLGKSIDLQPVADWSI